MSTPPNPTTKQKPVPVPGREGTTTVEWCASCRCKTWHFDGVCEWWDGHKDGTNG